MILEIQSNTKQNCIKNRFNEEIILILYFTLKPLYLFSSGLPQISDMFLIAAALGLLLKERGRIRIPYAYMQWVTIFLVTLVFQALVQSVWWVKTKDNRMLLYAAYYLFNFIASIVCIYIGNAVGTERLKYALCKGCFFSIIVAAIGIVTQNRYHGIRSVGFFNNPNQLGYYALLVLTVIAFFPKVLPKWQNIIILVVSVWANLLSLSKASIVGLAGLAICYVIWGSNNKTIRKIVTEVLLLTVLFGAIYWLLYSNSRIITGNAILSFLRRRLLRISLENDSTLGNGRGYNRVWELGYHFLWGKGEGAYDRFNTLTGLEVHSTFFNTLVSYGLFGFVAYFFLMVKPLQHQGNTVHNLACFSGLFLYFFTHNGIRNTLLWILLSAVLQAGYLTEQNCEQTLPYINTDTGRLSA